MEKLFDDTERQPEGFVLDFKRVLSRAIRFWYLVVLSLAVAFVIAFYQNRYSQRIYPITASVVIREMQEMGGGEFLYKNAIIDPYRNYLNEPYVIRSYPLIERVVRQLNFHVSFYREGYFMTTEAYDYIPVKVVCRGGQVKSGQFILTLKDDHHYSLAAYDGDEGKDPREFRFGDSIQYGSHELFVDRIMERPFRNFIGVPFLLHIQNPTSVAGSYIGRLQVEWAEVGAGIINLSLTGSNPRKEIDFLGTLIKEYQQVDLDKKNETADRTLEFIRSRLRDIRDSLKVVEFQLERFGNSSRVKDMSAEAQRLFVKVEAFEVQRSELLIRDNYYSYLEDYVKKSSGSYDQVILPSSIGISDPVLTSLLSKMIDLQLEVKLYSNPERGNNPIIASKIDRIQELTRDVQEAVRTLKSTDKIKIDFLNRQLKEAERQLGMLPGSERQLIAIQRNYSLLENLYVFLMQKLAEAGISKASNTSDVITVNPPMQGGAIYPRPAQKYTAALLLGLFIPLGIFILFELLNNKVQSKEDIDKMTTIPFLGGVGHNTTEGNLIVRDKPKSGVAESFRAMRSNLNYFTSNKSNMAFMVTSSISGEGKTFTTINLATVFALSNKKTLIVGADMRRPKIFDDLKCSNDRGLSTFLSRVHEFDQVVQPTDIENLFLVSGGPVPPNPSELLLTDRFGEFIREALTKFEFVIIDTPPLALVTDSFVISKYVDHTVFVLRQNLSPKQFIRSIDEYYRSGKIKSISILLNDIYKSGLGYGYGQGYAYHYGYSYGYGYGTSKKRNRGYYEE